jgi:hypothetical protein
MRTRHIVIGLCVVAVAIIGTLVVVSANTSKVDAATNGPLVIESGMGYFDVAKPGQGAVFSEPPIENRSNQPVTIDSIALDLASRSTKPMVVNQVAIGLPQRPNGGGLDLGNLTQAQEGPFVSVRGAVVGPAGPASASGLQGYSLIFAVNMADAGVAWSTGVSVKYHVGAKHYVVTSNDLFVLCTNIVPGDDCEAAYHKVGGV